MSNIFDTYCSQPDTESLISTLKDVNNLKKEFHKIIDKISENQEHWTINHDSQKQKQTEENLVQSYLMNIPSDISRRLYDELYGLGPLESLVSNMNVDEILIHGLTSISYELNGKLKIYGDSFLGSSSFSRVFEVISKDFFKSISYENPTGNGYWNNFRIHVIAPPLTKEIQISMRRIGGHKFKSLETLASKNFVKTQGLEIINSALHGRKNILICGATSSGKTTFIQCLMNECPQDRFLILEDSEELICPNLMSTSLLCPTRQEQYCVEFSMKDLVKESLRMRPDRIVLGEARSDEAKDYIQALSTGHKGCISSIHAASPKEALVRLECLISQGAPSWSTPVIRQLIVSGIDLVIHLEKNSDGMRQIKTIAQVSSLEHTGILLHEIYNNL